MLIERERCDGRCAFLSYSHLNHAWIDSPDVIRSLGQARPLSPIFARFCGKPRAGPRMDFVEVTCVSTLLDGTVSRPSKESCAGFHRKINTVQINYYEIKLNASEAILSEKNSS
jgi:hypothetical protein